MVLLAVQNTSLSEQVFQQLGNAILTGQYPPGGTLLAERELCKVFGVNRHAVREALKRLSQAGLVKISQGGKTQVIDFKRKAGLDLLALLARYATPSAESAALWLDVLEMRATLAADMVRICALRASPEIRDALVALAARMLEAPVDELFDLEVRFWDLVLDGGGNVAYRLAFNSMLNGALAMGEVAKQWSITEIKLSGYRVAMARAIHAGDAARAEAESRDVSRPLVEAALRSRHKPDQTR